LIYWHATAVYIYHNCIHIFQFVKKYFTLILVGSLGDFGSLLPLGSLAKHGSLNYNGSLTHNGSLMRSG